MAGYNDTCADLSKRLRAQAQIYRSIARYVNAIHDAVEQRYVDGDSPADIKSRAEDAMTEACDMIGRAEQEAQSMYDDTGGARTIVFQ